MFRVFDNDKRHWVKENIYMSLSGDLYILEKNIFGIEKLKILSEDKYIYHNAINLYDKYNHMVYEGDYIKATVSEDKVVYGLVVYAHELSSYIILCEDSNEFYTLGSEVTEHIEIIGNVYDGHEDNKGDNKQALQK